MKTLIVEDDITSSFLLQEILKSYGPTQIAVNGIEAIDAVRTALEAGEPYDVICMDIMMPELDGQEAVKQIRALEEAKGILPVRCAKIIMTTALGDHQNILAAFKHLCDAYVVKPIDKAKLLAELRRLRLIE
jgi:two-component system, chemotaxis family, chemotaxis protein CheY